MSPRALTAVALAALVLALPWATAGHVHQTTPEAPPAEPGYTAPREQYFLEEGYQLTLVTAMLTYPTGIALRDNGEVYVIESGYSYGSATAIPRVMRVHANGTTEEVARLRDGPLTGLTFHNDTLYVIGGRDPAEVWTVDVDTGDVATVLTGFPVWGHHFTSQIRFGLDDRMYFVVGYPSNSGVIGLDDIYQFQYVHMFPEARDIPCIRHVLTGVNFETPDPFSENPNATTVTGAFKPFGVPSEPGEVIEATPPPGCNGAVFSANADGSDLEVYATGLRNPYGVNFAPDGRLFLVDHGADNGGSRPIANDFDPMWEVNEGDWFGIPDYFSGFPVTMEGYAAIDRPPHQPLLAEHPPLAGRPFHLFTPSGGVMGFAFSPGGPLGHEGDAFVTQYGSQFKHDVVRGHRVLRLAMDTRTPLDFYVNRVPGPNGTAPERPIDVAFTPDRSAMYLVDFGALNTNTRTFFSSPLTGALWVITPEGVRPPVDADPGRTDALPVPAASVPAALGLVVAVAAARAWGTRPQLGGR